VQIAGDIMPKILHGIIVLGVCLILATLPTALCAKSVTASQQKMITEADNGKTIYIKEGQSFILKVNENPSTGYSWQLNLGDGLNLLWDKYQPWRSSEENVNPIIGAGGFHSWKIEATNDGQLTATYKRPWEKGGELTFTLNVVTI
jgi:inhibitor of cysteine peptidase